jgi:hypothetical protein
VPAKPEATASPIEATGTYAGITSTENRGFSRNHAKKSA